MNKFLTLLASALVAAHADAQTNAPVLRTNPPPPRVRAIPAGIPVNVIQSLTTISNRMVAVTNQIKSIQSRRRELDRQHELERAAGKLTRVQLEAYWFAAKREREQVLSPLDRQLAELALQQFNLRRAWKIPEPKPVRKR